jgi:hypothetical protein
MDAQSKRGVALLTLSALVCVSGRSFAATIATRDPRVLEIIERAAAVPQAISHVRVKVQHVEMGYLAPVQPPLSAVEQAFYSAFTRNPQPDGSTLLIDRNDGEFENRAPGLSWTHWSRIGGDGHAYVAFSDRESAYIFMSRHPESISRRPVNEDEKSLGSSSLRGLAEALRRESRQAESVRWRGRELTQGVLCDVIDLSLPKDEKDPVLQWGDNQETYYIGIADGLIHRKVEMLGPAERRYYAEALYAIDTTFKPVDLSYARFQAEVKRLLKGKPVPPVVQSK